MLPKFYAISNVLQRMDLVGEAVFVYCHIQKWLFFFILWVINLLENTQTMEWLLGKNYKGYKGASNPNAL